jgi:hypothetical protein
MASRSIIVGSSNSAVKRITGRTGRRVRKQSPSVIKPLSSNPFHVFGSSPTGETVSSASAPTCDLLFENHFSLFLIRPVSPAGQAWLDENIADDAQTLGDAIACEGRYVEAIYHGATADGLVCR